MVSVVFGELVVGTCGKICCFCFVFAFFFIYYFFLFFLNLFFLFIYLFIYFFFFFVSESHNLKRSEEEGRIVEQTPAPDKRPKILEESGQGEEDVIEDESSVAASDEAPSSCPKFVWIGNAPDKQILRVAVACSGKEEVFRQICYEANFTLVCEECQASRSLNGLVEDCFVWACRDGVERDQKAFFDNNTVGGLFLAEDVISLHENDDRELVRVCLRVQRAKSMFPNLPTDEDDDLELSTIEELKRLRQLLIDSIKERSFMHSRLITELVLVNKDEPFEWLKHREQRIVFIPGTLYLSKQSNGTIIDAPSLQSVVQPNALSKPKRDNVSLKLLAVSNDHRAILKFKTPNDTFVKAVHRTELVEIKPKGVVGLCDKFMNSEELDDFKVELESEMEREGEVPHGIRLVEECSLYADILVQQTCQMNLRSKRFVSWQESKLLLERDGKVILPCSKPNSNSIDDEGVRNRFLSEIWSIYGAQGLLIMCCLLGHSTAHLFRHLRSHESAMLALIGLSESFKSSLLKHHAMALACSKNVAGELHAPGSVEEMATNAFLLVLDDIGKSRNAAKYKLYDLAALVRNVYNTGSTGTRGKVREMLCTVTACFNKDSFDQFCALDDSEGTLMSRTICIYLREKNKANPAQEVRLLTGDEQSALFRSLTFLNVEDGLMAADRNSKLRTTMMRYGNQIFQSFINYEPDCLLKEADFCAFVEETLPRERMIRPDRNLITLRKFVRENQLNLEIDREYETAKVPMCAVFSLESRDLQALIQEFKKRKIIHTGNPSKKKSFWGKKNLYTVHLDVLGEMEDVIQADQVDEEE